MTRPVLPKQGLYAITSSFERSAELLLAVEQAIKGGAAIIQYRDKVSSTAEKEITATKLAALCERHSVPLVINDDIQLASISGAHGVHLGKDDPEIGQAREVLGPEAIIGISCYNSLTRALEAQQKGADYVAFGRFFSSRTKPEATGAEPVLLQQAKEKLTIPVTAIGGITPENAPLLIKEGANLLAVISAVFDAEDPQKEARAIAKCFKD